jgi:hypothetical protein
VLDLMERARKQVGPEAFMQDPEIETLIILDRDIDIITPMLTPSTYEGLIDELYEIKDGLQKTKFNIRMGQKEVKPKGTMIPMNSGDHIFREIRELHFKFLPEALLDIEKALTHSLNEKANIKKASEMKAFTEKLPQLKADLINIKIRKYNAILTNAYQIRRYQGKCSKIFKKTSLLSTLKSNIIF